MAAAHAVSPLALPLPELGTVKGSHWEVSPPESAIKNAQISC